MHQKKRKLSVNNNSIPIHQTLYNRKYVVSYSIPLSCMVALLLLGIIAVNPGFSSLLVDKSSAVTIQDEWVVTDSNNSNGTNNSNNPERSNPTSTTSGSDSTGSSSLSNTANQVGESDEPDDSFGGFGEDNVDSNSSNNDAKLSQSDQDAGISLMSIVSSPTLSITVSNSNQTIQAVQGGNTVYGSYNVSITGSNVKDYTLSIKADSVNLVSPSQASTPTTIAGAGGKTGSNMSTNTWGYKLTETSTAESSYGTLAYASLPTTLTQIDNGNVSSPYDLSATKKLVFAAKFAETATPGTYSGHITLSVVASQAVIGAIWSNGVETNIANMQDISSGFCKNNSSIAEGDTIELKDSRDTNTYTIYKAADGNCWMGQNLALTGPKTLASGDTDLASGTTWNLPASVTSWNTSDYNVVQIRTGSTSLTNWKNGYGNYYSWSAATAGTGTTSVQNTDASASICPKGWKLPTYSGDYSFQNLTNTKSGWTTGVTFNGVTGNSGYYFGTTKTTLPKNANFWPAAGNVNQTSGALDYAGSYGFYWSRRAYSNTNSAYNLYFSSGYVDPQGSISRYIGLSVRCVATY